MVLSFQLLYGSLCDLGVYGYPLHMIRNDNDDLVDIKGRVVERDVFESILDAFGVRAKDGSKIGELFIDPICEMEYEVLKDLVEYKNEYDNGYASISFKNKSNISCLQIGDRGIGQYTFCTPKVSEAAVSLRSVLDKLYPSDDKGLRYCYTVEPFGVGSLVGGICASKMEIGGENIFSIRSMENSKVDDCIAFLLYVTLGSTGGVQVRDIVIFDGDIEFCQLIYNKRKNDCTMVLYGR